LPATERGFLETPPQRLYVDTDFILTYLVSTRPHHARCRPFVERVQGMGITTLYVSSLVWLEYAHVITRPAFRSALPEHTQREFAFEHWENDPAVRQRYFEYSINLLNEFLDQIGWVEVSLTDQVRAAALQFIGQYNMGSHDAANVASAQFAGVIDLASFDQGYRRVDGLFLWNDRIHDYA
jgi:predicted nucleic acid-binding protein